MKKSLILKISKRQNLQVNLEVFRTNKVNPVEKKNYDKVFCIGFGKTGTTSLEYALRNFGFRMGNQAVGEVLAEDWYHKRVNRILRFCETADAFQDMPFGLPGLYRELDKAFPKSKFILTVRSDPGQWYQSLIKFSAKVLGSGNRIPPSEEEIRNSIYRYKGWAWDMNVFFFLQNGAQLYDRDQYIKQYNLHRKEVNKYFSNRTTDFLEINVAENRSYQKLANFLGVKVSDKERFPWRNKTDEK